MATEMLDWEGFLQPVDGERLFLRSETRTAVQKQSPDYPATHKPCQRVPKYDVFLDGLDSQDSKNLDFGGESN